MDETSAAEKEAWRMDMDLSTDLWLTCTEVTATFNVQLDEHTQLIPTFWLGINSAPCLATVFIWKPLRRGASPTLALDTDQYQTAKVR